MKEEELLELLESGDYRIVNRALIYIEKKLKTPPSPKLRAKLVELCSDSDPDIRQEAVHAAGFYWQLPEAWPVLVGILSRPDEDDIVLNATVHAISQMAHKDPNLKDRGLRLLAQTALNESMPLSERESAYAEALHLAGRISIDTYAKMGISSEVVIDEELMSNLYSGTPMPPSARTT